MTITDAAIGASRRPAAGTAAVAEQAEAGQRAVEPPTASPEGSASSQPASASAPEPRFGMLRELYALFAEMTRARRGWPIIRLVPRIVAVLIGNMIGQVRLNQWNGAFFDALEKRNTDAFIWQFGVFFSIIAVLLALVVAQTWLQEMLKVRIRRAAEPDPARYLAQARTAPIRLGFVGEAGAAAGPAHPGGLPAVRRVHDRTRRRHAAVDAVLLVTFIGVLWVLSSSVGFTFNGRGGAHSRLHGLGGDRLCRDRLGPHLVRRPPADRPQHRALCARGGAPLRPRARQRERGGRRALLRRAGRAAEPRAGRSTPCCWPCGGSRGRSRG